MENGHGALEEEKAYGVAADCGDDRFADAGDVLPVREELLRVHFGDFIPVPITSTSKTQVPLLSFTHRICLSSP